MELDGTRWARAQISIS